jgi:hypothetical protein
MMTHDAEPPAVESEVYIEMEIGSHRAMIEE